MTIITDIKYDDIRELYICCFVDTEKATYKDEIEKKHQFSDGFYSLGYLWDFLHGHSRESERRCFEMIRNKGEIYVMWDAHSDERILIADYWKYPKKSLLKMTSDEFFEKYQTFPEDIYIFDDTFSWSVVLTHEYISEKKRYCLIAE